MKKILLFAVAILILSCSKDDDGAYSVETYTKEDLNLLHNGSSKTWVLDRFYENYPNNSKDNDCYVDDVYVFTNQKDEKYDHEFIVEVLTGDVPCKTNFDIEEGSSSLNFYEDLGKISLSTGRGYEKGNTFDVKFFTLPLIKLTEKEMIFSSGDKRNIEKALVFRALD